MKRLLAATLLLCALAPARAAGIAEVPAIEAPLSFPVQTKEQFFAGSQKIVDLGGEPLSKWTMDLAKDQPQAQLALVNLKGIAQATRDVKEFMGVSNISAHEYDFFRRPEGHPTGERVIMNSPHFGGIETKAEADKFAEMLDAHMEPGGRLYAQGDDLWYMSMVDMQLSVLRDIAVANHPEYRHMDLPTMSTKVQERRALVLDALRRRFGAENVSEEPIRGWDPEQRLNAADKYSLQVRKPARSANP